MERGKNVDYEYTYIQNKQILTLVMNKLAHCPKDNNLNLSIKQKLLWMKKTNWFLSGTQTRDTVSFHPQHP